MKTTELTGRALDWAVANCEGLTCFGHELTEDTLTIVLSDGPYENFSPSREWALGGAIIEREMLTVTPAKHAGWQAFAWPKTRAIWGDTPLEAAMRCYVASKLGDEIEVPDEFMSRV
jgi:hypothetical protein